MRLHCNFNLKMRALLKVVMELRVPELECIYSTVMTHLGEWPCLQAASATVCRARELLNALKGMKLASLELF